MAYFRHQLRHLGRLLRGGQNRFLAPYAGAVGLLWIAAAASAQEEEDPGWIMSALQGFMEWLICWIVAIVRPIVDWILSFLPDETVSGFATMGQWFAAANYWFPVSWAFGLLSLYFVFVLAFILAKFIWKAIPATG